MNKKLTLILLLVVVFVALLHGKQSYVKATSDYHQKLQPYVNVLNQLNEQLGTNYAFLTEEQLLSANKDLDEMVSYYTAMDLSEFMTYILNAHKSTTENNNFMYNEANRVIVSTSPINLRAYTKEHRLYYSLYNYLFISSTVFYADGAERYSSINNYGYAWVNYPYYYIYDFSHQFKDGNTKVDCVFKCFKHLDEYLIDLVVYTIPVEFSAGDPSY
jgi:hypothetical protein